MTTPADPRGTPRMTAVTTDQIQAAAEYGNRVYLHDQYPRNPGEDPYDYLARIRGAMQEKQHTIDRAEVDAAVKAFQEDLKRGGK